MNSEPRFPSGPNLRQRVEAILNQSFASLAVSAVTVLGIAGLAVGVALMIDHVTVVADGVRTSCGSVFLPTEDFTGRRATCGNYLSDRAVFGAAFIIGGIGFVVNPFAAPGICRVLFLAGLASAAAALTGLADELSLPQALVAATYAGSMATLSVVTGLRRTNE